LASQVENFLTLTLLATGTPMLLMGDEVRRTQGGNNNAFCQNNEISWFDWTLIEKHADFHRFVRELIALRMNRNLPVERLDMTLTELLRRQPIQWHGVKLNAPDWGHESHTLAGTVRLFGYPLFLHLIINACGRRLSSKFPRSESAGSGGDASILPHLRMTSAAGPMLKGCKARPCLVQPRSVVLLLARSLKRKG
jgi:glycogen operon protein